MKMTNDELQMTKAAQKLCCEFEILFVICHSSFGFRFA